MFNSISSSRQPTVVPRTTSRSTAQHEDSGMRASAPAAQGLYNPINEHDSCGVGFVAHIKGQKSHSIIQRRLRPCNQHIVQMVVEARLDDTEFSNSSSPSIFYRKSVLKGKQV